MNLIFLLLLTVFLNYTRFFILISFNNISILIFPPLSLVCFIYSYSIHFIHFGGNVIFSKKKRSLLDFSCFLYYLLRVIIFMLLVCQILSSNLHFLGFLLDFIAIPLYNTFILLREDVEKCII